MVYYHTNALPVRIDELERMIRHGDIIYLGKQTLPWIQRVVHPFLSLLLDTPFHHAGIVDRDKQLVHFIRKGYPTTLRTFAERTSQLQIIPIKSFLQRYHMKHTPIIHILRKNDLSHPMDFQSNLLQGIHSLLKDIPSLSFENNHLFHILNYMGWMDTWKRGRIHCNLFLGWLLQRMGYLYQEKSSHSNDFHSFLPFSLEQRLTHESCYTSLGYFRLVEV